MAITLTGSGGLFTRLGQVAHLVDAVNTFRGGNSAGELVKEVNDCLAEVDGASDAIRAALATLLTGYPTAQSGLSSFLSTVRQCAQNLLIQQVNDDTPLPALDVASALAELKRQMVSGGDYVTANTVGGTVTAGGSNVGDGAIAVGLRDIYGNQLDNLLAESILVSVTGNATAGSETLKFAGEAAQTDRLALDWPLGSGASKTITSLLDSGSGNLVSGGSMETFSTANVPDGWTLATGTAGTETFSDAGAFSGSKALKLGGGTGVLTKLTQALTGLSSRTPYGVNFWIKNDVNPAAGVLVLDLYDGSAVIEDEAGNACSLTVDLTTLGTTYVAKNAVWILADPLPTTVTLRLRLSTAISSGSNTWIDAVAMQQAAQLTTNPGDAPWVAAFGGSVNWSLIDTLTLATSNNRTCAWQQAFDRLFETGKSGFLLPTSGSTLINDSLIS